MASHINFKNFSDAPDEDGSGSRLLGNFPLSRQPSIYTLTFDELQNLGGVGKDFGSMNMDELLKNIWTAEETQVMMTASAGGTQGNLPGGTLQRQGSLTLPRTLSQKTVDEVWRNFMKEGGGAKDGSTGCGGSNFPQRQRTLGEMTLEEFLVRAGVVREDAQQIGMPNNSGFYGELSQQSNHAGLALGLQQTNQNNQLSGNNNAVAHQSTRLAINVGEVKSLQQQPQTLFPKSATVAFASTMPLLNTNQLVSSGAKSSVTGTCDPSMNNNFVHSTGLQSGGMGIVGLGSPASQVSSDVTVKNTVDTPSLSSVPYVFGRGRKCSAALEKVIERRQRRMIKNRESAARSRARKQAYTLELEAEIAKLKELNRELQKKQAHMIEMQKNQMLETIDQPWGSKRQCLRRTLTGPW